jgi:hypothetical protein
MMQNVVEPSAPLYPGQVLLETDGDAFRPTATDLEVGAPSPFALE